MIINNGADDVPGRSWLDMNPGAEEGCSWVLVCIQSDARVAAAHLEPPMRPGAARLMTKASFLQYLGDTRGFVVKLVIVMLVAVGLAMPGVGAVLHLAH